MTAIEEQAKVETKKDMVHMAEHIKALGDFKIKLELAEGIEIIMKW